MDDSGLQRVHHLWPITITLAPPSRVDHGSAGGSLGVDPEGLRQRSHELAQGGLRLIGDRRGRADEQKQRLRLDRRQTAEVGAGTTDQRPAATPARLRVDRNAGGGQRSRSRRAVATDTSSSLASSDAVT
nr:hypothetical protein [Phytoactinopolyspora limicola]